MNPVRNSQTGHKVELSIINISNGMNPNKKKVRNFIIILIIIILLAVSVFSYFKFKNQKQVLPISNGLTDEQRAQILNELNFGANVKPITSTERSKILKDLNTGTKKINVVFP